MSFVHESVVEEAAIEWLEGLGYLVASGLDLAHDGISSERESYADVVLSSRLRSALTTINPIIPAEAIEWAIRKIIHPETLSLIENNERFIALQPMESMSSSAALTAA